jgi:hypothetical protein
VWGGRPRPLPLTLILKLILIQVSTLGVSECHEEKCLESREVGFIVFVFYSNLLLNWPQLSAEARVDAGSYRNLSASPSTPWTSG